LVSAVADPQKEVGAHIALAEVLLKAAHTQSVAVVAVGLAVAVRK